MTGPEPSPPPAGDGLSAARAKAAELGMPLSEYVRDQLRRTRGDQAWERALAQAGESGPAPGEPDRAARRARREQPGADVPAGLTDPASGEALWR